MSYGDEQQPQRPSRSWVARLIPLALAVVAAGVFAVSNCQEGPFGRRQVRSMTVQDEMKLGAQAYQEILGKSDVVEGGPAVDVVKRLGGRLARASKSPDFQKMLKIGVPDFAWEFQVVRSKQVNAFCLPGGKVVVYTGILPVCQTEAGLATVMGHEIGHALAHHGAERMAQQQIVSIGQSGLAASLGDYDPKTQQTILAIFGAGAQVGFVLPYSRDNESEADHIGLLLMATAGYDPREASRFWVRMQEQSKGARQPEFMSTHPGHERRAQQLEGWLKEAVPLYDRSDKQPDAALPLVR